MKNHGKKEISLSAPLYLEAKTTYKSRVEYITTWYQDSLLDYIMQLL